MTRIVVDSKVQSTSTELVKSKGALNSTLISNKYWPPSSRITIIRTYTKTFASVPKETSPVLITRVVGNERLFIAKKILPGSPEKAVRRKKRRKISRMAITKLFCVSRKRNKRFSDVFGGFRKGTLA